MASASAAVRDQDGRGRPARNRLLFLLLVIQAFNYVDRQALGLMLQDIKVELALTDTQLGVLTGIAFAVFYSLMGIPIARWADRGNRVAIITIATLLWSVMVGLAGLATSFAHLILIRIGVAVGEAGCMPPAHSLIADYFSRAERPRAVAIFMLSSPLSVIGGYFFAGWLNEILGWRATFVLMGLPGVFLAAAAWFLLVEPRRAGQASAHVPDPTPVPSLLLVWRTLWGMRTFRHLLLAFSVISFFGSGIGQWKAAFFIRSYGLGTGELGTWFALTFGLTGLIGTYIGGEVAARFAPNDERAQLKAIALVIAIFGVFSAFIFLTRELYVALALTAISSLVITMVYGPLFGTIQTLVPDNMRAMSIAVIYLCSNLIGSGLGPLLAGVLSDGFASWAGKESLRYALVVLCVGYFWSAWHLAVAGSTVASDLAAIPRESGR